MSEERSPVSDVAIHIHLQPIRDMLPLLLMDRTTRKNILFASESCHAWSEALHPEDEITEQVLYAAADTLLQPCALRGGTVPLSEDTYSEIFSPSQLCAGINDYWDALWFGRITAKDRSSFPEGKSWKQYVDARCLEITCGEAPFLASRYDAVTGAPIPLRRRVGILDRKLRVVSENTETQAQWMQWALRAFQSVYGYECRGERLLIARINLLLSFADYLQDRWARLPYAWELRAVSRVISWNMWQMDGLHAAVLQNTLSGPYHQLSLDELCHAGQSGADSFYAPGQSPVPRVFDWRGQNKSLDILAFREGRNGGMKFDFIVGNPPAQEKQEAVRFMEETYSLGDRVALILPARFLLDGVSPLPGDTHTRVLRCEPDSRKLFPQADIPGGVCILYRDGKQTAGDAKPD